MNPKIYKDFENYGDGYVIMHNRYELPAGQARNLLERFITNSFTESIVFSWNEAKNIIHNLEEYFEKELKATKFMLGTKSYFYTEREPDTFHRFYIAETMIVIQSPFVDVV